MFFTKIKEFKEDFIGIGTKNKRNMAIIEAYLMLIHNYKYQNI